MALIVKGLPRVFMHDKIELSDPNSNMTPEEVLKFYMGSYPELTSSSIHGPEIKDDKQIYKFDVKVGTKG